MSDERKPWEETWRAEAVNVRIGGESIAEFDHDRPIDRSKRFADDVARAGLAAEAPAMWHLLASKEWGEVADTPATRIMCPFCFGDKPKHNPGCEWFRIAKAIGYK